METIKLIATDLDCTLLNDKHEISEYNKKAIKEALKKGLHIILSTGRPTSAASKYMDVLGLDTEMISFNGAMITNKKGDILYEKNLDCDIGRTLIEMGERYKIYHQGFLGERWNICHKDSWLDYYISIAKIDNYTEGFDNITDFSFSKFMFIGENKVIKEIAREVEERFGNKVYYTFSRDSYLEVHNPEVSKASALKYIMDRNGIKREETMGFGDNLNDIEMLNFVNVSIAVANAQKNVKEQCKFVTESNVENGVGKFLNKYFDLKVE